MLTSTRCTLPRHFFIFPLAQPDYAIGMSDHILSAYALSGPNAGKPLTSEARIVDALKASDLAWLHLKADHADTSRWIREHLAFLAPVVIAALVAEETRPRTLVIGDGVLVILRGVNTNPGADPDDMVSIRLWVHDARIVSLSRRPLESVRDIQTWLGQGRGPDRAGAFLCLLVEELNERIEAYLRTLDEETDTLEERVLEEPGSDLSARISEARRQVVAMRRHIGSQRDALDRLANVTLDLIAEPDRVRLHEAHDRLVRTVEELDAMRDRLHVLKDELANHQSERLNRNLYILSLVSAMFLPLAFLTGLMGINLAGMPGAHHPAAFWTFTSLLAVIALLLALLLRRMRMF